MNIEQKYKEYVNRHTKRHNHQRGKHSALRDSQQSRCYSAEFKFLKEYPEYKECLNKKDAEKYFNSIRKSKMWKDNGWLVKLDWMKDMGGVRRYNGIAYDGFIRTVKLSPSGSSKYTILHEMTHCLGYWNHDRMFRIWLVKMVSRFLGQEEAKYLKQCFKDCGLKMSKPRKHLEFDEWKRRYIKLKGAEYVI